MLSRLPVGSRDDEEERGIAREFRKDHPAEDREAAEGACPDPSTVTPRMIVIKVVA